MRRETGADFVLLMGDEESTRPAYAAGETNLMDLIAEDYGDRLGLMDLTGEEILSAQERFAAAAKNAAGRRQRGGRGATPRFVPAPAKAALQLDHSYRVVVSPWAMGGYVKVTQTNPASFRLTPPGAVRRALKQMRLAP